MQINRSTYVGFWAGCGLSGFGRQIQPSCHSNAAMSVFVSNQRTPISGGKLNLGLCRILSMACS